MMLFWTLTAVMIAAALAIIAPALLRRQQQTALDRNAQNVAIARERLAELDAELAKGEISAEEHAGTRIELEQVLLQDLDAGDAGKAASTVSGAHGKIGLITLGILLPLLSVLLYQYLGTPSLITTENRTTPVAEGHANAVPAGSMADLAIKLRQRLEEQSPDDANGWYLLGRTYMTIKDYPQAAQAFDRAYQLTGAQPAVMLALADALTMSQPDVPSARAAELVEKALALEPENTTALWMAGLNAADRGDYSEALRLMQKLHPLLAASPQDQQQLEIQIARLSAAAGIEPPALARRPAAQAPDTAAEAVPGATVRLRVSLSPAMQQQANAGDTVFIYARAMNGPRFPLAAARHRVSDLPLEITLSDAQAVMPTAKLSDFPLVKVGARISASGDAIAQSGDLIGERTDIRVGGDEVVELVIDSVQP
jgi:cytochrome c-type biogenesis protein CcmH